MHSSRFNSIYVVVNTLDVHYQYRSEPAKLDNGTTVTCLFSLNEHMELWLHDMRIEVYHLSCLSGKKQRDSSTLPGEICKIFSAICKYVIKTEWHHLIWCLFGAWTLNKQNILKHTGLKTK